MSLIFKKRESRGKESRGSSTQTRGSSRTVKYVELYGSISSLAAGLSTKIIDYTIPDGHCAELYAVGIMPDYDVGLNESNLLDTEIGYDSKLTGIKFLTNHMGMNALPYGDRLSKQPMRLLDYPQRMGSLTPKFNEGMKIQIVVTAGAKAVDDIVRARAKILLYEEVDAMATFGVGLSKMATISGGVEQSMPYVLLAEYARLSAASGGKAQWTDLYTKDVKDFEQVILSYIGIFPHANADDMRLYDLRLKKEFPEYEPYWKINADYNALPFGDDGDYQPTAKLPSVVASYVFTNTTMSLKFRDLTAVVPQYGIACQVLGTYRRVR